MLPRLKRVRKRPAYSGFFRRRRTIKPSNVSAKTAQMIRIIEESIAFLLSAISGEPHSEVVYHGQHLAGYAHRHGTHRHYEERRQNTEEDREHQLHAYLGRQFLGSLA
jgi:hypothetical protein